MKKFSKIIAIAMASAMLLAGCGAKSGQTSTTGAESATNKVEATTGAAEGTTAMGEEGTAAPAADLPSKIVVGTNAEFPPFEYVTGTNKYDGFDIAVMQEVGKRIGCEVEISNMEFKSLLSAMTAGNIDVVAAAMTVTPERSEAVDFTDSYYTANQYMVVAKDSTVAKLNDLDGKKIGVQEGTTGDLVSSNDYDPEIGIKDAEVSRYKRGADAIQALLNGALDAVVIDANPAQEFVKVNTDKLKYIEDETTQEQYAFAVQKGSDGLKNAINGAIKEMKADGTFDALVAQYITQK